MARWKRTVYEKFEESEYSSDNQEFNIKRLREDKETIDQRYVVAKTHLKKMKTLTDFCSASGRSPSLLKDGRARCGGKVSVCFAFIESRRLLT